jgi:hypothetical protein
MIPPFVFTPLFAIGGTAALVAVAAITWKVHINSVEARGAAKAVAKIEVKANEVGKKQAAAAAKAIDTARKPGAFERLRADPRTCTDCDR